MTTPHLSTPSKERAELAEHAEKWGTFILANILWAILSIPLITLPAATAGLFAYMSARARGLQPDFFQTFFDGIRQYGRKASVIALLNLPIAVLVVANALIFPQMNLIADPLAFLARSVTLFVGLALLLINLYVWSLLVLLEQMTVRQLISASITLVFAHPAESIGVFIAAVLPVLISLFLPQGVFAIATASTSVLIICTGTWRVIRQHLSSESA